MLLPFQVTMVPNVLTLRFLGLLNTVWSVVLPMWFAPFFVFLIRQFMVSLPDELLRAFASFFTVHTTAQWAALFLSVFIVLLIQVLSAGYKCYCLGVARGEAMPYESLFDAFSFVGKALGLPVDEKAKTALLTRHGIEKAEKFFRIEICKGESCSFFCVFNSICKNIQ